MYSLLRPVCPPHYYYLFKLLGVEWSVAVDIANYAYPICAQTAIDWESDPDATGEMCVEDLFLYIWITVTHLMLLGILTMVPANLNSSSKDDVQHGP